MQQVRETSPTETQSLVMMRNLLRTAISTITYVRGLFPEDCFSDRLLAGVNIKSLLPTSEEANLLCRWLEEGVFEALNHKFLRVIIFGIYTNPEDPTSMLECYSFDITYPNGAAIEMRVSKSTNNNRPSADSSIIETKEQIKKATIQLLRTLISMASTLKGLPDDRYLTMKLLYYDERTPQDYEPKFFKAANNTLGFDRRPVKIKIGTVTTPYHSMAMKIQTVIDSFNDGDSTAENSQMERLQKMRWNVDEESEAEGETEMEIDSPVESQADSQAESQIDSGSQIESGSHTDSADQAPSDPHIPMPTISIPDEAIPDADIEPKSLLTNGSDIQSSQSDGESDDEASSWEAVRTFATSKFLNGQVTEVEIGKEFPGLKKVLVKRFAEKIAAQNQEANKSNLNLNSKASNSDEEELPEPEDRQGIIWRKTAMVLSNNEHITQSLLRTELSIGWKTAKTLITRLEKEEYVEKLERGAKSRSRKVLKQIELGSPRSKNSSQASQDSQDHKEGVTPRGEDPDSELCDQMSNARMEDAESQSNHGKKRTHAPMKKNSEVPENLQKKLSKFDFSSSQETDTRTKTSQTEHPIHQKNKKKRH
eukprot:TRINITY_DN9983_c0_g1_i1.p2 TRINITY_DN9983_c0_g1~~TRINITY_DN9983_c0_g1_i1.p2  ORF type:complete len:594 (+),score=203.61 TRINITY_DN9983_c0_g1_i1:2028-3809(+)